MTSLPNLLQPLCRLIADLHIVVHDPVFHFVYENIFVLNGESFDHGAAAAFFDDVKNIVAVLNVIDFRDKDLFHFFEGDEDVIGVNIYEA